jgi:hypothetical protein
MRGLIREEATQIRGTDLGRRRDAIAAQELKTGAHVTLIRLTRQIRQTTLDTAVNQEIRQGIEHHASLLFMSEAPVGRYCVESPAYRPAKEKPRSGGVFLCAGSAGFSSRLGPISEGLCRSVLSF